VIHKVCGPYIRARLGTAAHFCGVVVLSRVEGFASPQKAPHLEQLWGSSSPTLIVRLTQTYRLTQNLMAACLQCSQVENRMRRWCWRSSCSWWSAPPSSRSREREFFIDNLLVRIHFIIVTIRWTGLAPWEFEFPFGRLLPPPGDEPLLGLYQSTTH